MVMGRAMRAAPRGAARSSFGRALYSNGGSGAGGSQSDSVVESAAAVDSLSAIAARLAAVSEAASAGDSVADASGADPYSLNSGFNKALVPWHVAAGAWGPQRTIQEAALPVTLTEVTVTTWADFQTQMILGSRIINIGADINGGGDFIDGNVSNVVVVLPAGRTLRSFGIGGYSSGHTCQRMMIRGSTLGTHSGGRIHNVRWTATTTDLILDGIDITGPGVVANASPPPNWVQQCAIAITSGFTATRVAINKCRGMCGNYFFLGEITDLTVTESSFFSAAEAALDSGIEGWVFRLVGNPGASTHVFWNCDLRGTRFHKVRIHPNGTEGRAWFGGGRMVDLYESGRLLTSSQTLVSAPKGYLRAFIADGIECWTDNLGSSGTDFSSNSAAYVRFRNLIFHSASITSDASLSISDAGGAPNVPIPDGDEDWVKENNTYLPETTEPGWLSATPGDPTGLVWNIGP